MVKSFKELNRSCGLHFCGFLLRLFKVHFQYGQPRIFNINWLPNTDSGQHLVCLYLEAQNEFSLHITLSWLSGILEYFHDIKHK